MFRYLPLSNENYLHKRLHILHSEGPDNCNNILKKAVKALEPEGLIAIHDFILDDSP